MRMRVFRMLLLRGVCCGLLMSPLLALFGLHALLCLLLLALMRLRFGLCTLLLDLRGVCVGLAAPPGGGP